MVQRLLEKSIAVRLHPGLVLAAFAAYGALWGPYLAALPEIKRASGADESQLGIALLAGAVAAVPAMIWAGRLLDRFGRVVVVSVMVFFAVTATLPLLAGSVRELIPALALFGFGSGACNVVVVALASTSEADSGTRLMNRAHALFSVGVLVCGFATGAAKASGVPSLLVAVSVAGVVTAGVLMLRGTLPVRFARPVSRRAGLTARVRPATLLCLLMGLAMVVESGVQQWSAVFLSDVVGAPPGWSAAAPGVFAGAMALGRLGGHWLSGRVTDRTVLVVAGLLSGAGVLMMSIAELPAQGLAATAVVGAAVSVTTPTTYGLAGRGAPPGGRGMVIGSTASLASIGLLLGPALVGQVAGHSDLRIALALLAPACLAVSLLALRVTR